MAGDVDQQLAQDTEERDACGVVELDELVLRGDLDLDPVAPREVLGEPLSGGHQPDVVEHGRAQLEAQRGDALPGARDQARHRV